MAYATEQPRDFTEFYTADVPNGQGHWHYNSDRIVKLDSPARRLFLRYTGDPGVNNIRIYTHSIDDRSNGSSPVLLTHAWKEAGALKRQTVTLNETGSYEIKTDADPENVSIEMSIESQPTK